jgi:16S rRNA (guanine527-N7)-methyltransferase
MDTTRIASLLSPFISLSEEHLAQTLIYINLLLKWNSRVNLTAVRRPEEIVTRHFGESYFVAARLLSEGELRSAIDLGSGAGFPGVPLAMLAPQARVTLIESNGKKVAFLNEVIRTLNLGNVSVFGQRGESYPDRAELVIMRAVEKFEASIALASNLVNPGGRLALLVGMGQVEKAQAARIKYVWSEPTAIPGGHSRVLLVGTKPVNVG